MRKMLSLILVLMLALVSFASCENLPPEVTESVYPVLDKIGLSGILNHEHSFTAEKTVSATCTEGDTVFYKCYCGEEKTEVESEPLGHDNKLATTVRAACNKAGSNKYVCSRCSLMTSETIPSTGHSMEEYQEVSRLIACKNSGCSYAILPEGENKYAEVIVYKFSDEDLDLFDTVFAELGAIIDAADPYSADEHSYEEGSDTHSAYLVMEAKYEELYDVLEYVTAQYQIAQVMYHVNMGDAQNKANYEYISDVRTDLVSEFYSFSQAIYDSMYRDYYYYGMTEEEIKAFIFESDAVSNPEYKALVDRNNEIELEFLELSDPSLDDSVLELYYEFVDNNKKIAKLMGYDSYLEYAYENIYDRDYSYTDVATVAEFVKDHLAIAYGRVYSNWSSITSGITGDLSDPVYNAYYTYISDSFFTNPSSNKQLNNYIDLMAFTSNSDKQISFSDELNSLMGDGNLFRGQYSGAYVTSLYGMDIPIAYFGTSSYSGSFTVAHEFGHYMNEIYSGGEYSQSFDLLEMHSQGNELLYLAYLKTLDSVFTESAFEIVETYQILVMLDTIMNALAVDTFEQAVYTDNYNGTYADQIMADGKITADEYDLLYKGIIIDFKGEKYMTDTYWRYVTINAPCYYVSYAVSAISVLQLYPMAQEDFSAAQESYLKLFTYIDEDPDMITSEILQYAGLYTFTDEELYELIADSVS